MAAESALATALARDINCLGEENRSTRKRALQKISDALLRASPPVAPDELLAVWDSALRVPVLKLFADPVEKNREMALTLVTSILEAAPDVGSTLPTLLPTIAARVGAVPYAETCEEVRLQLVELARLVVRRGGTACAPHTKELAGISASLAADAFPDVKRDVCALARELAAALPTQIGVHCAPLAKALAANLAHAHSKVRAVTLDAMCVLLLREDSALPELAERLVALAADHTPSVREQCARQLGELLVSLPDPAPHTVRLLPVLLHALSDEVASVRETALGALRRAGERAGPGADGDRAGVAHAAPQTPPPRAELPPPFDAPPPWGAVQLAQAELAELLAATVAQLRDWTAAKRLRGACTLLGLLWLARGAMTEQLDALLGALYAAADDDDAAVRAKVAACARMAGTQCDVAVALGLAARHCERSDSAPLAHRSACLLTLANLLTGVGGEAVGPHVRALARTLCRPQFCAGPAVSRGAAGAADDAGAAAYAQLRVRLADVVASLVEAAPAACAEDPQGFQLYATLVQLAAVPSAADDDYAPQRRALSVLDARLAPACGLDGAGALHARHGGRLLEQLVAGGLAPDDELAERLDAPDAPAGSAGKKGGSQLVVELGGTRAAPGARAAPNGGAAGAERASGADPPYSAWTVSTHEWHVLQTLLQHAPGEWAASQLLGAFPVLAALLEPSREPALRLTALTVVQRLLADPAFCAHDGLREWAALLMQALLIPNLVWRAGRAAQQVRLGAALCLRALVQLEPAVLTASELTEAMPTTLPVLRSALEDDGAESRLAMCSILQRVLPLVGARLKDDEVRGLYPDLLKRLDDANDAVRLAICPAIEALLGSAVYDQHLRKAGANLDESNLSYLVRGVLVHLDDFSPEIQAAAMGVLRAALRLDPAKVCSEITAVRERHRTPKLCDALLAEARAAVVEL